MIRHTKLWCGLVALAGGLALVGPSALARGELEFNGSFSEAQSSGGACDGIFTVSDYHALHALAGPTQRTSVLKLTDATHAGFFDGMVFVGLLGGSNDLDYDKTSETNGVTFQIHAEGFIDQSVVYLEFKVRGLTPDHDTACTAKATFSGFD